jgi:acetyl esterase
VEPDDDLLGLLDLVNSIESPAPDEQNVEDLRDGFAGLCAVIGAGAPEVPTEDLSIDTSGGRIPVRIYRPLDRAAEPLPALIWFHGGGWVIGSIESHDGLCRDLCAASGCAVVSVEYRLAPEHRYPAAHDDAEAVTRWLLGHAGELGLDGGRVAIGGDSAGGHLATVTSLRLRDRPHPGHGLRLQLLVQPVTDLAGGPAEHPSLSENSTGYLLTTETMDFFRDAYVPDPARRQEPDASPLRAGELGGLPPAVVVTAGLDPLRDEGRSYAERLQDAGVPTVTLHQAGAVHLVAQIRTSDAGVEVLRRVTDALRCGLSC